jgi:hypothetical protein
MNYRIRKNCIICNNNLETIYFKEDLQIPLSCYLVDKNEIDNFFIPYNICVCPLCKTSQTKYLGDLNLIYKENHADSTGNIMKNLHLNVVDFLRKYITNITNITEIGSSYGMLSDLILKNFNDIEKYYIIEPSFHGIQQNKQIIINDFFENVNNDIYNDSNTLIISHVFEHFYNPIEILKKIENNSNIKNILLVWPDLECYKDNNTYHILNTEHTFYIDNNLVEILFNNHSFKLIEKKYYEKHSVIFLFTRNNNLEKLKLENINYSIDNYYNFLLNKKENIIEFIKKNKLNNKKICIWPASVHTQFLLMCLKLNINEIDFILDNSINKIGKYLYGYKLECKSFENNCNNNENAIILNGGCFNKEVINNINIDKEQIIII